MNHEWPVRDLFLHNLNTKWRRITNQDPMDSELIGLQLLKTDALNTFNNNNKKDFFLSLVFQKSFIFFFFYFIFVLLVHFSFSVFFFYISLIVCITQNTMSIAIQITRESTTIIQKQHAKLITSFFSRSKIP